MEGTFILVIHRKVSLSHIYTFRLVECCSQIEKANYCSFYSESFWDCSEFSLFPTPEHHHDMLMILNQKWMPYYWFQGLHSIDLRRMVIGGYAAVVLGFFQKTKEKWRKKWTHYNMTNWIDKFSDICNSFLILSFFHILQVANVEADLLENGWVFGNLILFMKYIATF